MKIGIISDTHDRLVSASQAISKLASVGCSTILHGGDWTKPATVQAIAEATSAANIPLIGVWGNNDRDVQALERVAQSFGPTFSVMSGIQEFQLAGKKFVLYHGHHKPTLQRLIGSDIDVLVRGHSHAPQDVQLGRVRVLNPGSTAFAIPRRKGWLPTVMVYDIDSNSVELILDIN